MHYTVLHVRMLANSSVECHLLAINTVRNHNTSTVTHYNIVLLAGAVYIVHTCTCTVHVLLCCACTVYTTVIIQV